MKQEGTSSQTTRAAVSEESNTLDYKNNPIASNVRDTVIISKIETKIESLQSFLYIFFKFLVVVIRSCLFII